MGRSNKPLFSNLCVDLHATPSISTPKPAKTESADDDEPPLNEDDDDDDDLDDLDQGEEEPSTNHLVLAQFDKVTPSSSSYKLSMFLRPFPVLDYLFFLLFFSK